jgi:hypothetical protein
MTTTPSKVEDLKEQQAKLREREKQLVVDYRAVDPNDPAGRDKVKKAMEAVADELMALGPRIAEAKETAAKAGLQEVLNSAEYQRAQVAACDGLAAMLEPWQALYEATKQAQRVGFHAPALPPTVGIFFAAASDWLTRLVRVGALDVKALPPTLRRLMKEER